ncbi:unnamed protein product [Clonostachys rosea f. rosea IK726]|uniref:Invertebrate defensins family profile domain-containing protein n=2 Tax=Bionectria ochroleuca TaxID=29856 RepID=A0A0B7KRJ4_BIOOC|nr:unnamed protein product [Clonostachys rosea f. rosea IK726]
MHFIKTIVSLFALSSVAVARIGDADLEGRDVAEVAHEEYLVARDEYIEKRELFRRLGGNGTCRVFNGGVRHCMRNNKTCGPCASNAKPGQFCLCNA